MADWKKLLVENPPASDIASSPSSGKVLKVSSNGTGLEWADDAGGAFSDNGSTASVTDRIVTITGSSSAIPTLDINPPFSASGTSYSRIRVQTSGRDLRFNLRNGASTSDVMTIAHNNKVGIGTSSPGQTLHVDGNIRVGDSADYIFSNKFAGLSSALVAIQSSPNNDIAFNAGGAETVRFTSDSKVGIGTSSPSTSLEISGGTSKSLLVNSTSGTSTISAQKDGNYVKLGANGTSGFIKYGNTTTSTARDLIFFEGGGSETMRLTDAGKLGIGTTSVDRTLHVKGANHQLLKLESSDSTYIDIQAGSGMGSGNAYIQKYAADGTEINRIFLGNSTDFYSKGSGGTNFYVSSNNTQALTIKNNANIGIGTNAPSHKFHINHSSSTSLGLYVAHSADEYGGLAKFYTNSSNNTARSLVEIHSDNASSSNIIPLKIIQDAGSTALHVVGEILTTGNFQVEKSYPDIMTKSNDEGRIGFMDAGGSIRSGMKNGGTGILKFIAGGNVERMRITTDGIVGINTTSPDSNSILHIVDGAGTMPTTHAGDSLIVQNNANTTDVSAIYAIAGTDGSSHIVFGDADSKNPGRVSYYHNSDYMSFHTNTTEQMRITSAGNVGIGTTSPLQPLHIESNNNNSDASVIIKNHNADGTCGISFRSGSANNISIGIEKIGSNFAIQTGVGLGSGTRLFTVTPNGSVGIGTSSPSGAKLHVYDASSSVGLKVERGNGSLGLVSAGGSTTFFGTGDATDVEIGTNSSTLMFFDHSNSNIGIGTSSPSDKLHVADTGTDSDGRIRSSSQNVTSSIGSAEGDNRYFFAGAGLEIMTNTNHDIRFGTNVTAGNATPKMVLDTSGRLGIGTSSPTEKLHVAGNILLPTNASSLSHKIRLTGDSTHEIYSDSYTLRYDANVGHRWNSAGGNTMTGGAGTIEFKHSTSQKYIRPGFAGFHLQASHDGGFGFVTVGSTSTYTAIEPVYTDNNTSGLKFNSRASGSTTERMRITSAGNVGIGTSSPARPFHVHVSNTGANFIHVTNTSTGSGANDGMEFGVNGTDGYVWNRENGNIYFGTNDSTTMFLANTGRVGIGTTSPSTSLDVNGNIKAGGTSRVYFNTNATGIGSSTVNELDVFSFGNMDISTENSSTSISFKPVGTTRFKLDSTSFISLSNNDNGTANTLFGKYAGLLTTSGAQRNVYVGELVASSNAKSGDYNVGVGYTALQTISSASNCIGIGNEAGFRITTGSSNTAVGSKALKYNQTGQNNTAIGTDAMLGVLQNSCSSNTAVGASSMYSITDGANNVAIGYNSAYSLTDGDANIAIGKDALYSQTSRNNNIAIGYLALYDLNDKAKNVAIGTEASEHLNGENNISIGYRTLKGSNGNSDGIGNVAVGGQALEDITTGDNNVAIGINAGNSITTSSSSVFVGSSAGSSTIGNTGLVLIGRNAGPNVTGSRVIAIGNASLNTGTAGSYCIAMGYNALNVVTGADNIGIGYRTGYETTDGEDNIFIGSSAGNNGNLSQNVYIGYTAGKGVTGNDNSKNVAIGFETFKRVTTGTRNVALGYNALSYSTTGGYNVAIGYESMKGVVTGDGVNVAVGYNSLLNLTSGNNNVALGGNSLEDMTTGFANVAIGRYSARDLVGGSLTVAIGHGALISEAGADTTVAVGAQALNSQNMTTGTDSNNVGIGYLTSYYNVTGVSNTAIGASAMKGANGQSHSQNTAIGANSMLSVTTGSNNSSLGQNSLYSLTTGANNVALGKSNSFGITTGTYNVGIGNNGGKSNQTGSYNVSIGNQAMQGVSGNSHSNNVAIGNQSMLGVTTSSENVAIGSSSLQSATTGNKNIAIGYQTLRYNVTGAHNIALGHEALEGSSGNSYSHNTAIGVATLKGITTGGQNVAVGNYAGDALTTGTSNVVVGYNAFSSADGSENNNVVIGFNAGSSINSNSTQANVLIGSFCGEGGTGYITRTVAIGDDTLNNTNSRNVGYGTFVGSEAGGGTWAGGGDYNTAIGYQAFKGAVNGADNNTAIGATALNVVTTGSDNVAVGTGAGLSVTTGYDNSLLGKFAGKGLTTGDGNTLVGDGAGNNITQGRRNTVIGKGATTSADGALDQIVIGWGATGVGDTSAMIGGSQVTDVYMGDNGSSWSTTSDGRLKENIKEWTTGLDAINKLRIVEYNFKEDNPYNYNHEKKRQGIIAQEAIEAIPEMIKDDGEWLSANQEPMIWALVNAVQELTKKVNELETKLNKEN